MKRLITALVLISLLLVKPARADENKIWTEEDKCSVTLDYVGGNVIVYQVAVAVDDNGDNVYQYTDDFAGISVAGFTSEDLKKFTTETLGSANAAMSAALLDYATNPASNPNAPITPLMIVADASGGVVLTDLPAGLYLFNQTEAAPGYTAYAPYLLSLPFADASGVRHTSGTTIPKTSAEAIPVPPPPVPPVPPDTPPTPPGTPPDTPTPPPTPPTPPAPPTVLGVERPLETDEGTVLGAVRDVVETPGRVLGATRLPKTGLLWWPLFFLLAGGAGFTVFGLVRRHKANG